MTLLIFDSHIICCSNTVHVLLNLTILYLTLFSLRSSHRLRYLFLFFFSHATHFFSNRNHMPCYNYHVHTCTSKHPKKFRLVKLVLVISLIRKIERSVRSSKHANKLWLLLMSYYCTARHVCMDGTVQTGFWCKCCYGYWYTHTRTEM